MPTTKELVNWLKVQADGWERVGEKGLLEMLNEAQNLLYQQETFQTIAVKSNGELPVLVTSDGDYDYTLNQATTGLSQDIWRCAEVLLKPPYSNEINVALLGDYGLTPKLEEPAYPFTYRGEEYMRFNQCNLLDKTYNSDPVIKFSINPGATTTDYYLLCYLYPTQLTSEAVQSAIPERLHMTTLLPTAAKLVEAIQNNTWADALAFIEMNFKKKFRQEMNGGDQGVTHTIKRRAY